MMSVRRLAEVACAVDASPCLQFLEILFAEFLLATY